MRCTVTAALYVCAISRPHTTGCNAGCAFPLRRQRCAQPRAPQRALRLPPMRRPPSPPFDAPPPPPLLLLLLLLLAPGGVRGDFEYRAFNDSAGLRFNGAAGLSSCLRRGDLLYSVVYGVNDAPQRGGGASSAVGAAEATVATVTAEDSWRTARHLAAFPHRDAFAPAPDGDLCDVRLRLTPARPHHAGSVMRLEPAPVLNGFESGFTFQVTDHSQACTQVKDAAFGTASHKSCAVAGGDGFAFVLHGDPAGSAALGGRGGGLGYAGLANALVVEFDTWYNGGGGGGDAGGDDGLWDHVSVHASPPPPAGAGGGAPLGGGGWGADDDADVVSGGGADAAAAAAAAAAGVTPNASCALAPHARADLADGLVHSVRVVYWRSLRLDLLGRFAGSPYLLRHFVVDAGEGRRVGTLAVFLDDAALPLVALPINLNAVLRLPDSRAFLVRLAGGRGEGGGGRPMAAGRGG